MAGSPGSPAVLVRQAAKCLREGCTSEGAVTAGILEMAFRSSEVGVEAEPSVLATTSGTGRLAAGNW